MNWKPMKPVMAAYNLAWKAARPLVSTNNRIKDGLEQRTLESGGPFPCDVWIQGASGGESYLTWELLRNLDPGRPLQVLATTNTRQGMDVLTSARSSLQQSGWPHSLQVRYFPFDSPGLMKQAMQRAAPKVAVILETEIWPGFLTACQKQGTKTMFVNGRMNAKSLGGYLTASSFFKELAPDLVMAISERDAQRFATLFGHDRIETMPNIKFDRMASAGSVPRKDNPLINLISAKAPFVVFGSVREQEEPDIERIIAGLLQETPKAVVGLFPRHMFRLEAWQERLADAGIPHLLRSAVAGKAEPGTVLIWDTFGELVPAYGLARAAFVGGSLARLGGQNFLEPLTCGVIPVIGPHWKNFHWVGQEIVENGLVLQANDWLETKNKLVELINDSPKRQDVVRKARAYIADRRGGAKAVCKRIAHFLDTE